MKADKARSVANDTIDPDVLEMHLEPIHNGIDRAAGEGQFILIVQLNGWPALRQAITEALRADGYQVRRLYSLSTEQYFAEVSWHPEPDGEQPVEQLPTEEPVEVQAERDPFAARKDAITAAN